MPTIIMNNSSTPLETVFQEVTEYFADLPDITVTPGEGTPPEFYAITYNRAGACKGADGEVTICSPHKVSISFPFGFPQFPPECQPESPTFHPDFESSAITIDDAWEADQSVVKLILHLGRMISGEIYSKTDAVNEAAAEWYTANSNRLPFKETSTEQETLNGSETKSEASSSYTVDFLDDEEFEQSFSLEKGSQPENTGIDPDFLRLMAKQRRFNKIQEELKKYDDPFDGRTALEEETQSALNKATVLFQEANDLEYQGKHQETLDKLNAIEKLVIDTPLIKKSKQRVEQAMELLGDWMVEKQNDQTTANGTSSVKPEATDPASSPKAFIEDSGSGNKTKLFLLFGGCAIILCTILIVSYFYFDSTLKKGENRYSECRRLLNANNFTGAEQKCEEALDLIANISVVKQDEKRQLTLEIRSLLDSPKLLHGLTGKTLLDGTYVTRADRKLILEFKETMEQGDSFFNDEHWQEAGRSYGQALALTKEINSTNPDTLANLHERTIRTKIYLSIEKGKGAFAASQWDTAITHYEQAIKLLAKNSTRLKGINVEQTHEKLARIMLHAAIIRDRQAVERYLSAEQYDQALNRLLFMEQTITASQFAAEQKFQAIFQEISSQIDATEHKHFIANQEKYLTDNYKDLFLKHYPSAIRSKLSKPRAEYLKNKGDKLLFRMQCTETTGGRPLRLQMNYLYSPANESWQFYSEE